MAAAEAALEAAGRGPPDVRLAPPEDAMGVRGGGWGRSSEKCSAKKEGKISSDVGCVVGPTVEILPLSLSLFLLFLFERGSRDAGGGEGDTGHCFLFLGSSFRGGTLVGPLHFYKLFFIF